MKKSIVLSFVLFNFVCSQFAYCAQELISYSSAVSVKYELSSINRNIKTNQRKINSIKSSSKLSNYEKKRQIQKLERENYYLERKSTKIKRDYSRAIS